MLDKFQSMYEKKAYFHWYLDEGMSEIDFQEAEERINGLLAEYRLVEQGQSIRHFTTQGKVSTLGTIRSQDSKKSGKSNRGLSTVRVLKPAASNEKPKTREIGSSTDFEYTPVMNRRQNEINLGHYYPQIHVDSETWFEEYLFSDPIDVKTSPGPTELPKKKGWCVLS